jgi:hypothetical protein
MCPCREAYYCGSVSSAGCACGFLASKSYFWHLRIRAEHQKVHWTIHKQSCYTRQHKGPLSPFDIATQHLLQFYDTSIVEIAVMALLKQDIYVDFRNELERKAVVLTLESRYGDEEMASAVTEGRIPPYEISREVNVVSLEVEARNRGLSHPFFENPVDRHLRLTRQQLGVAVVFKPTGRATTKRVPAGQLSVWEMVQKKERTTTNPPKLFWQIMTMNSQIRLETMTEEEEKAQKHHYSQIWTTQIEGILFPEDEASPRMVKVKFDGGYDAKGKSWHKPDLSQYLPSDASIGCLRIDGAVVQDEGVLLGMMIAIFFNERCLEDSLVSNRNKCINRLTNGKIARPWAGPFFAFRRTHLDTCLDAVMEQDLPVLVEYFASGRAKRH